MHYCVFVLYRGKVTKKNVNEVVAAMLEPYRGELWDWWQVGGRWSGILSKGKYDPETDPDNLDRDGKVRWPTQWVGTRWDIMPLAKLVVDDDVLPYVIVTPAGKWHHRKEAYDVLGADAFNDPSYGEINVRLGVEWKSGATKMLNRYKRQKDCTVIVVDCHN